MTRFTAVRCLPLSCRSRVAGCVATALLVALAVPLPAPASGRDKPQPPTATATAAAKPDPAVLCAVSYGGTVHTIAVASGTDPYTAEAVDIEERFRFKAVVRGQAPRIEVVKVYVYLETPRQPVLLHEARYLAPFSRAPLPGGFTGEHTLIAPPLERQLHYACTLP